jgi:uncharacterized RDD family membrane protein YckC
MAYQPPAAAPFGPGYGAQATTQLAGFWRRFAAYIVDAIIFGIVAGIIEVIINAIVRVSAVDSGTTVRGGLVSLVVGLLYFGYFWSRSGQTLGYMLLGLRLVRTDGQPVTFLVGMLRYLLIYLSFVICLIPAIISAFMIGLSERKQGIHDLIIGTQVVRA